ncbi:MAG: TlpA disulfide reductase family protein [Dehalococcoidia bacterium]|nr:TlpA disulfide reductase family protein [Dehalococcoidia bacterium]
MKSALPIILTALFCAVLLSGCGTPASTCPKIGDKAPDFTLPGIDGINHSLSDYAGKPIVINTWSVSCIECKKEMPYFKEVVEQYGPKGLVFLSINTQDSINTTKNYLSQNGYSFTTLIDLKTVIYQKFCCPKNADPNTFFIGTDGNIKSIKIGSFATKEELVSEVQKLMP